MKSFHSRSKKILAITVMFFFVLTSIAAIPCSDESVADTSITVSDGLGNTITLSNPALHVVAVGKGASATVTELGHVGKIVVTDTYSNTASESVFDGVKQRVSEGKATAGGNMYSKGLAQLKTEIIDAADKDVFDKDSDVVILSGGTTTATNDVITFLHDNGFSNVLGWPSITTYEGIIEFVESISKVVSGGETDEVKKMKNVRDTVKDTLAKNGITDETKCNCFYVTYSSSTFKVGNTGSLGTSLLLAAGGKVVTINKDISATTYETSIPDIIETYGTKTVVAADNSIVTNSKADLLRTQVGDQTKVVPMESLWNNYSIDSMNGVWTLACAMYPTLFTGDVPELPKDNSNGDVMMYAVAGIVGAVIVIAVAVVLMRR